MKQSPEFKESLNRFDRLFRSVIAVPKADVEKAEAKDRAKNQRQRAKRKRTAVKK
jgi:hypothetical protein